MEYNLQVIIEQDANKKYVAECPSLQGCYTQGDTFEEVVENIKEVIEMCIEELKAKKQGNFSYRDCWDKEHKSCGVI